MKSMNVVVDGILVHYQESGDKNAPVALLLHGWAADIKSFAKLAEHLQKQYRVVRLDMPGFGASEQPSPDWHIASYAQFVSHFVAKVGLDIALLIGHSFGGRVSIKAIASGALTPQKLVLLDSGGIQHSRDARNQVYKAIAKTGKVVTMLPGLRRFQGRLKRALYKSAGSTDYLNAGVMKQIFLNTINEDLRADAAKITVPTLLIWGANDDQTPVEDGKILADAIKNSRLEVIQGAGHYVQLDAPENVQTLIDEFTS
jgi:pimeloyl-ACP methyl ester carboxylesterase